MIERNPALTSAPLTPKTTRNPADTTTPTARPRATLAPRPLGLSLLSSPVKYDRYAGSMAKPHGFTVATRPAANAKANGTSPTAGTDLPPVRHVHASTPK